MEANQLNLCVSEDMQRRLAMFDHLPENEPRPARAGERPAPQAPTARQPDQDPCDTYERWLAEMRASAG